MRTIFRIVGMLMMIYSVAYTAQFIFGGLDVGGEGRDLSFVWAIMNPISAVAICVAIGTYIVKVRSLPDDGDGGLNAERVGAYVMLYASLALAIWYFHAWVNLLTLEDGTIEVFVNVIWEFIGVMIPLIVATTGYTLWKQESGD